VDNSYQREKEGMEGDKYNENDSHDNDLQKSKEKLTPLLKYVTRNGGGKGVEPQNLHATIVIQNTQLLISM
jgi:hypothetical protein